ncbi:hypothetical protein ACQR1Y_12385 [Bradyrhizobium sp. HKCCYLRH3099]|uniref:hypothetical protein n=1 Tax=Bradyrhizobium TaxID=374 RepID=UPI003EB8F6F9
MKTSTVASAFNQEKIATYKPRPHWTAEDAKARKRKSRKGVSPGLRITELNLEYRDRYGRDVLPDNEEGRRDVWIMLNHLACSRAPRPRIANWLRWRAPWFDDDDMIDSIIRKPRFWHADPLGKLIGMTFARRTALALTTIGCPDMPKKKRAELRAAKEVARRRESRRDAGAMPREEFERTSIERQKPWIAMGCSRSTWFAKHRKTAAKTQSVANVVPLWTGVTGSNSYISADSQTCPNPPISHALVHCRSV